MSARLGVELDGVDGRLVGALVNSGGKAQSRTGIV
jgi:hypothetical protein